MGQFAGKGITIFHIRHPAFGEMVNILIIQRLQVFISRFTKARFDEQLVCQENGRQVRVVKAEPVVGNDPINFMGFYDGPELFIFVLDY